MTNNRNSFFLAFFPERFEPAGGGAGRRGKLPTHSWEKKKKKEMEIRTFTFAENSICSWRSYEIIANPRASTKWSIKVKLLAISHTLKFFRNTFSHEKKKKSAVLSLGFDKKKNTAALVRCKATPL